MKKKKKKKKTQIKNYIYNDDSGQDQDLSPAGNLKTRLKQLNTLSKNENLKWISLCWNGIHLLRARPNHDVG